MALLVIPAYVVLMSTIEPTGLWNVLAWVVRVIVVVGAVAAFVSAVRQKRAIGSIRNLKYEMEFPEIKECLANEWRIGERPTWEERI